MIIQNNKNFNRVKIMAKMLMNRNKADYIVFESNRAKNAVEIIPAKNFFDAGINYKAIICYLAYTGV